MAENTDNHQSIEEAVAREMEKGIAQLNPPPRRPTVVAATATSASISPEERNSRAMRAVDRGIDREALQIEAFVDSAIHCRLQMIRGAYMPGPRDIYVKKMMMDLIMSISASNSHTLDQ